MNLNLEMRFGIRLLWLWYNLKLEVLLNLSVYSWMNVGTKTLKWPVCMGFTGWFTIRQSYLPKSPVQHKAIHSQAVRLNQNPTKLPHSKTKSLNLKIHNPSTSFPFTLSKSHEIKKKSWSSVTFSFHRRRKRSKRRKKGGVRHLTIKHKWKNNKLH